MFSCDVVGETEKLLLVLPVRASWCLRSFFFGRTKTKFGFFFHHIIKTLAVGWRVTKPRSLSNSMFYYALLASIIYLNKTFFNPLCQFISHSSASENLNILNNVNLFSMSPTQYLKSSFLSLLLI